MILSYNSPSVQSVVFDRNPTTLTRTSTGGPSTTITWRKNNAPVNLSIYERLVNTVQAMYENVLFNANVANLWVVLPVRSAMSGVQMEVTV